MCSVPLSLSVFFPFLPLPPSPLVLPVVPLLSASMPTTVSSQPKKMKVRAVEAHECPLSPDVVAVSFLLLVFSRALCLCCLLSSCAVDASSGRESAVTASPSAGHVRNIIESTGTGQLKQIHPLLLLLRLHSFLMQNTRIHTSLPSFVLLLLFSKQKAIQPQLQQRS